MCLLKVKRNSCCVNFFSKLKLREKCPYLEFFWPVFSCIRTEYGEIRSLSPYSVQMWENTDQKNSEYGHFSRSVKLDTLLRRHEDDHIKEI